MDEFNENLIQQFEDNTQSDYEDASPAVKEQLQEGANSFWSTFALVGDEAKVLQKTDDNDTYQPEQ